MDEKVGIWNLSKPNKKHLNIIFLKNRYLFMKSKGYVFIAISKYQFFRSSVHGGKMSVGV